MMWTALILSDWTAEKEAKSIAEIIDGDTRPDFEEELPDEWCQYFEWIDGLPYPEEIILSNKTLIMYFELSGAEFFEFKAIMKVLKKLGGDSVYACLSEDDATQYYVMGSGQNVKLIYENDLSEQSLTSNEIENALKQYETSGEKLEFIIERHKNNQLPVA